MKSGWFGLGASKVTASLITAVLALTVVMGGASAASAYDADVPVLPSPVAEETPAPEASHPPDEATPPEDAPAPEHTAPADEDDSNGEPVEPTPEDPEATPDDESDPAENGAPIADSVSDIPPLSQAAVDGAGFGAGTTFSGKELESGTVLGAAGKPTDLGVANQHFVYFPLPSGSTTYQTGHQETLSMAKYVSGDAGSHVLAIRPDGAVYGWGGNRYGQLGTGRSGAAGGNPVENYAIPVSTLPGGVAFVQVSAGAKHSLALSSTGDIYAWGGLNNNGQLGQGNRTQYATGQSVAQKVNVPGVKFKQISAGYEFSLAVATDGSVYVWGLNNNGSTTGLGGDGTPTKIPGLANINMVSAGWHHSAAVSATGELFMWGYQYNGRLGNGQTSGVGGVQKVATNISWKHVSANVASTWAVATDGRLFAWGNNSYYQLGTGGNTDVTTPAQVASGVKQVWGNNNAAAAVLTDGRVMTAGTNNPNLQLGGGTGTTVKKTWGIVAGVSNASEVTVGNIAAAARGTNGTLAWGVGMQTGVGGTQQFFTPVTVNGPGGMPSKLGVTSDATLSDAQAKGSTVLFGRASAGIAGAVPARNLDVVTNGGKRYLRADVPPYEAGRAVVYLKLNDGTPGNPVSTQLIYVYNFAMWIEATPTPALPTETVDVVTSFYDPAEAPYVGASVVDFSIPAATSTSPQLTVPGGAALTGVSLAAGSAATKVKLVVPNPPANDGPNRWKYEVSATARAQFNVAVNRNVPTGHARFATKLAEVYLWKTGESANGREVGMGGSSWKVHPDSLAKPGRPDLTQTLPVFSGEIANPNTKDPERKSGWFKAELSPGTYWLVETRAPAGFQLMAEALQFTVSSTGAVTLGAGKGSHIRLTNDWDRSATKSTIVVRDMGKIPLPESGSGPLLWITVVGLILLVISCAMAVRRLAAIRRRDGDG